MSDPLKTVVPAPADALTGAERDARVERLLLHGLDHYFGGDYDTAVHVWTRVLFLDRGHARARAYIERARSAQAERQRESEELLHRGVAAFDRGDTGDARELLTAAVSQGTEPEVALSYLGRLDRLEVTRTPARASGESRGTSRAALRPSTAAAAPQVPARRATRVLRLVAIIAFASAAAVWAGVVFAEVADFRAAFDLTPPVPLPPPAPEDPLPVPRIAELSLLRARAQLAAGFPADALRTLDAIGPADPLEGAALRLRADIDRMLLASAPAPSTPAAAPHAP
jgi:hypothetical protein